MLAIQSDAAANEFIDAFERIGKICKFIQPKADCHALLPHFNSSALTSHFSMQAR